MLDWREIMYPSQTGFKVPICEIKFKYNWHWWKWKGSDEYENDIIRNDGAHNDYDNDRRENH